MENENNINNDLSQNIVNNTNNNVDDASNENGFKKKRKSKFKIPTSFTIIFFILLLIMVISWILHYCGVSYIEKDGDKEVVKRIKAVGIVDVFVSVFEGYKNNIDIVVFVLSIGAFIYIVMKTKSLDALAQQITYKFKDKTIWAIPIIVIFLSFCGSAYGLAEEALGFHMIVIPLMLAAGFDVFTSLMTVLLGGGIGPMAATFDPFLIITAAKASESDPMDGLVFRAVIWVLITGFTSAWIMIYAKRVKKNPELSYTFSTFEEDKEYFLKEQVNKVPLTKKRIVINIIFLLMFLIMIAYLFGWDDLIKGEPMKKVGDWVNQHMPFLTSLVPGMGHGSTLQVAGFFLIGSLIITLMNWQGEEMFIDDLMAGAKDIISVAFVIGTAGGITALLKNSGIQAEIKHLIVTSNIGDQIHPIGFISMTYLLFIPLSFLLSSTSGFANAVFPFWGEFARSIKVNGINMISGSITAFAFSNSMVNMISPVSGIVVGAAQISRTNYATIMKGTWKFHLTLFLVNWLFLLIGTGLNYTGLHIF